MTLLQCFARANDYALVHLREARTETTLCGLRAFPRPLARRATTCPECLKAKPSVLGGDAA